ncbi:hypothetical protein [Terricaulis sp.]|uniref:hypothetical protein n=1 Tax=Terricaulis sp. TaxID=2768686 RepID=UPI003784ACDE
MLLGVTFFGLQLGFGLMVAAWAMMLSFLHKHPMPPAQTPADGFTRWTQFMEGKGFPDEAQPQRKLIAYMFIGALSLFAIAILCFFIAGGPDALPPPSPRTP